MTRTRNPNADPARVKAVKDLGIRRLAAFHRALQGKGIRAGRGTSPLLSDAHLRQAACALECAIAHFGSIAAASRAVYAPVSSARTWVICPPNKVVQMAAATGYEITPHELRPDIYPYPEDGCPREMRSEIIIRHNRRAQETERMKRVEPGEMAAPI